MPIDKWRYSLNIGVLLGYKIFLFTNYFGLRIYGSANVIYIHKIAPLTLDYVVNFEALVNFVAKYNFDFGAFCGVGVGGLGILRPKNANYLNLTLNAGFRTNIAKHYGVEIMIRTAINDSQTLQVRKFSHFSANLRILYHFDR